MRLKNNFPYLCPLKSSTMEIKTQTEIQSETQSATETHPEPKTTHCLNCDTEFQGKFCPECGQSAETERFTMRFIFENLLTAFFSKDGIIWFTYKSLFTRPGAMIVEILKGKRRKYLSPFPMLICSLTIYILLYTMTGSQDYVKTVVKDHFETEESGDVVLEGQSKKAEILRLANQGFKFYYTHYTAAFMLTFPVFLFSTRAWYGKSNRKRYHRAEYLVVITYSMVMVVYFQCISSIAFLFSERATSIMDDLIPIVMIAALTGCFSKMLGFSIRKTVWRSVLAVAFYYLIVFAIIATICICPLLFLSN